MSTRADVVNIALGQDGYHNGLGYDEVNMYAQSFGINYGIAYCDIFVAWCFEQAGIPLPRMNQIGVAIRSGAQYCPDSYAYAAAHNALRPSWTALPGDQVIFNWNGDSQPLGGASHTELVERWVDGSLYTVGGNSGPSNVDGFTGTGGVHRHVWPCPQNVGNSLIQGVIDTSKLVTFTADEEFVMDAQAIKAFTDLNAKLDQLIQIMEGGFDPKKNPFGLEGFRDIAKLVEANETMTKAVAAHLGVKV